MKGIFDSRQGSGYNDEVERKYHFPNRYLPEAQQTVGDWIVYREPKRGGGREGYVAVAKVDRITADQTDPKLSYAIISDFLPFDSVVPLRRGQGFYEDRLQLIEAPSRLGAALQGRSIRTISESEFGAIVRAGLSETLSPSNAIRLGLDGENIDPEVAAFIRAPLVEQERRIATVLLHRKIRDAAFRRAVLDAYDNRCAVTGIRMVNGGGKAEAQAAHIWAVADNGPDVVQNGLALSGTIHWLFDRHLISLTDEYTLLVSHNRVPSELRNLFARQLDRIHLPADQNLWPDRAFVKRHRDVFVG